MIAVTGATGQLGELVVQNLVNAVPPSQVVALVRNPSKAEGLIKLGVQVRKADYTDAASWASALEGVKSLLLISSNEVGQREAQHRTVIEAAKRAGVQQLAYTSILRADREEIGLGVEHLATEKAILASGIPYTFLRNGWYLENQTGNLGSALEQGAILGAADQGRFSAATREDYALAAVKVLSTQGHANKIYEFAGDQSYTIADLAAEVSKQSGKQVVYANKSYAEYKQLLLGFGLPEVIAEMLANSDASAAKGALESQSKDLSNLIGRATTPMAVAVTRALKK